MAAPLRLFEGLLSARWPLVLEGRRKDNDAACHRYCLAVAVLAVEALTGLVGPEPRDLGPGRLAFFVLLNEPDAELRSDSFGLCFGGCVRHRFSP